MALALETMPGGVRQGYIDDGRNFGSDDTLAQANQTLEALEQHAEVLVEHGFGADDLEDLTEARDGLIAAGVGREAARSEKKKTSSALLEAMKKGKQARRRGRSVLTSAERKLRGQGRPEATEAAQSIGAVLAWTSRSGNSPDTLATQLDQLRDELRGPVVAAVSETRGGPQALLGLSESAAALRNPSLKQPRGTVAETEHLDLLDGIVVSLVRDARRAARSAATELGRPALAKAFELTRLYRARVAALPTEEPPPS